MEESALGFSLHFAKLGLVFNVVAVDELGEHEESIDVVILLQLVQNVANFLLLLRGYYLGRPWIIVALIHLDL